MTKYFMSGTPLAWLEREMMTPPGFGSRRVKPDAEMTHSKAQKEQAEKIIDPAESARRMADAGSAE